LFGGRKAEGDLAVELDKPKSVVGFLRQESSDASFLVVGLGGEGEVHAVGEEAVGLAPPDKGDGGGGAVLAAVGGAGEVVADGDELEPVVGGGDGAVAGDAPVDEVAGDGLAGLEVVDVGVDVPGAGAGDVTGWCGELPPAHLAADGLEDGPLVFLPCHREEGGLAAHGVGLVLGAGARGETHAPPVAVCVLEEIGVADGLEVLLGFAVREERVAFVSGVRAGDLFGAGHGDGVVQCGAALGDHEVVPSIFLVDVGTLGPDAAGAVPDVDGGACPAGVEVELLDHHAVGGDVDLSIVVPEEVGVNLGGVEEDGVAPCGLVIGVGGLEENTGLLAGAEVLADDIEGALVFADRCGEHALLLAFGAPAVVRKLRLASPDMADHLPLEQVLGGVDGQARKGDEGRDDAVKGSIVLDARRV